LLQKSSRKNENISPFLPGGGSFPIFIIFMYKKNIAVYNNKKKKKQTRELCVRARVCLSVSVLFMCAQYGYKSGNAKKNGAGREKKKIKKKRAGGHSCVS